MEPIELNAEQCRDEFLAHLRAMVGYWDDDRNAVDRTRRQRMEGLVFSILAMIDGCSGEIPSWIMAPCAHPDDKAYAAENNDETYWPTNPEGTLRGEITNGTMLHELWYPVRRDAMNKGPGR